MIVVSSFDVRGLRGEGHGRIPSPVVRIQRVIGFVPLVPSGERGFSREAARTQGPEKKNMLGDIATESVPFCPAFNESA